MATWQSEKMKWIKHVVSEGPDGLCRDWPWPLDSYGRPKSINISGVRIYTVSHVVLKMAGHPRPPGLIALHSCDRPSCLAPWHLSWGTYERNAHEAVLRLGASTGERNGRYIHGRYIGAVKSKVHGGPYDAQG